MDWTLHCNAKFNSMKANHQFQIEHYRYLSPQNLPTMIIEIVEPHKIVTPLFFVVSSKLFCSLTTTEDKQSRENDYLCLSQQLPSSSSCYVKFKIFVRSKSIFLFFHLTCFLFCARTKWKSGLRWEIGRGFLLGCFHRVIFSCIINFLRPRRFLPH